MSRNNLTLFLVVTPVQCSTHQPMPSSAVLSYWGQMRKFVVTTPSFDKNFEYFISIRIQELFGKETSYPIQINFVSHREQRLHHLQILVHN